MFTAVLCHLIGDYVLQTHWMANEKTKRWWPAVVHALTYGIPFAFVVPSIWAWLVIVGTHAVIDRYRLARHIVWLKNQLAPKAYRYPWRDGRATGYAPDLPPWLATWLMIITDNVIHVAINAAAITWL